jgi:hypothetical protein
MARLSDEQVIKNMELVKKLVAMLGCNPRRADEPGNEGQGDLILDMLDRLPEYFTAPASSREDFHGCFPGGLCDHSLRVTKSLRTLAEALVPGKYPKEKLIFLGLMHDLGKVGDENVPMYLPHPSDWHRKQGMLYVTNKALEPYLPICDRTMYLLQKFNIGLEAEEYVALRISDGPYEKCNEKYSMKEPDLAVLLHMADRWACALEKRLT